MENTEQKQTSQVTSKKIKYYTVIYLTDGTIHLWPGDTKEDCITLADKVKKSKYKDRVKEIRYIKRDMNNYKDGYIL